MSMTEEEARYEQWMDDLYAEHSKRAVEEFTGDRLRSYYQANPRVAKPVVDLLQEARSLLHQHPTPALVFAAIAIEAGLKQVLLRPIVSGLVNSESAASLITDLALERTCMRKFRDLLFQVLSEHAGVHVSSFVRPGSSRRLWDEIIEVQNRRNAVMHRAEQASFEEAAQSVEVAAAIVENLFPAIATYLGFHLHDRFRLCSSPLCGFNVEQPPVGADS